MGFQREAGGICVQDSHSLGEKAVEQSGGAGSDALEQYISQVYSTSVNVRKPWKYFNFALRSA